MSKRVIVIGGGFGGLAAAARLAAKGHRVSLYDKRDKLGGRAYQYEIDGFRFDGGPTVITAPHLFDEIWELAGRRREDDFELVELDPFYRMFDHEGRHLDYRRDVDAMAEEVRRLRAGDVDGFHRFAARTQRIFDEFMAFTDRPFSSFADMLRVMPAMVRTGALASTHWAAARHVDDPLVRKALSFHPLLIGGNPFTTPSLYTLIAQFEREWGVHYAVGGTGAIVQAFGRLLEHLDVEVTLGAEVRQIAVEGGAATGVELADGTRERADVVICNGDAPFAYRTLVDSSARRWWNDLRIRWSRYSMSLVVIYFGTNRRYEDSALAHHNVIFSESYRRLLRTIFSGRALPDDLSLYLHMPTRTDPSIAPPGCESFYVLAPVPHLGTDIDWDTTVEPYTDLVLGFLEERYLPELRSNVVAQHCIDPRHFQSTLNSERGAAFSLQPSLMQSAWFRPHARSEDVENLYFVGAGTHPGAGVPAVLSSGKIAAELIDPAGELARAH